MIRALRVLRTTSVSAFIGVTALLPLFAHAQTAPPTGGATSTAASEPAANPAEGAPRPFNPITPSPAVPIPGVRFTPAQEQDGIIRVPYLAQYISGIYRLSVGLGSILAAIMIVFGGFKYLLAASLPQVKDGKAIITDAFIGLVVLMSSYIILRTINPALVTSSVINVGQIDAVAASEQMMFTTRGVTSGAEFLAGAATAPTSCPFPDLPAGHIDCGSDQKPPCTAQHCTELGLGPNCRDSAVVNDRDPRTSAFIARMTNQTHNPDPRQRVVEVANAAANCAVHMGSCGNTARTIRHIASFSPEHHPFSSSELVRSLLGLRCERPNGCRGNVQPNCTSNADEARERVRAMVRNQQDARADMLQPGDYVWIYNGNSADCAGQHSIIFIGWEGPYARVVQGQWGHYVRGGRVCLRTSCPGGNFSPITRIQ